MNKKYKIIYIFIIIFFLLPEKGFSADVFILLSSDIIPYQSCVQGLETTLDGFSLTVFDMKGDLDEGERVLKAAKKEAARLVVAVGPQAAYVISRNTEVSAFRLFCMVRNPGKILGQNPFPGVSLNMPAPRFQLTKIKQAFKDRHRVGIFYDPTSNQAVVDGFVREAKALEMEMILFPIRSRKDISRVINSDKFSSDVLLIIPDEQLRSEKIIGYIIKESLKRKIPVIGYNSWFAKNGALLSFLIDYREIGRQTGRLSRRILRGESIDPNLVVPPDKVDVSVDLKTAKKLGIRISREMIDQAQEVVE